MRGVLNTAERLSTRCRHGRGLLFIALMVICHQVSVAADWRVTPTLQLSEIYSDNIALQPPGQEETDFVTQISPGVQVHGQGGRVKLDMSYRLQNLIYANDDNRNASNHQLAAKGNAELVENLFYVDARSSISQQIVSPDGSIGIDNINPVNRADVFTYGISPYLKLRLASYANAELRYSVDRLEYQGAGVSDGETQDYSAHINSGPAFSRLLWNANFHRNDVTRDLGVDSQRESGNAELHYRLFSAWSFLARGGYEDNDIPTVIDPHNGSYWSAGLEWAPSRHFAASATTGENNWDASLLLRPTDRTSLHVGYRDRDIGLVRGPSWDASLSHRARRTTWVASYLEESTTVKTLQLTDQQFFVLIDGSGNIIIDPATGQPIILVQNIFGLRDEDFLRKRGQLSVTFNTGKSSIILSAFNERRTYSLSDSSEDVVGGNASWGWRFAPRTRLNIGGGWQQRKPEGTDQNENLWHGNAGISRALARDADLSLEYTHLVRNAILAQNDYTENRIILQLNKRF